MAVGKKIKLTRENNNLTRKELAEMIQVTDVTISRYENGTREPNIENLKKIAKVLNVDINYLLANDDEDTNEKESIFSKFPQGINIDELKIEFEGHKATIIFFKSLGYDLNYIQINEDGDYIIDINGIEYTQAHFDTLIKMIETCIENAQELMRNSNK